MSEPAGRGDGTSEHVTGRVPEPTGLVQYEQNGAWVVVAYDPHSITPQSQPHLPLVRHQPSPPAGPAADTDPEPGSAQDGDAV
ncbi:hypothetical protein ACFXDH_50105 [Streptomyces sp. NPDC059467]|uniref:hypothetical protein n=1 Tax=Streptomyces sp. NPDC059467 TaxID=3346844 RepID=UPI0036C5AFFF